MPFEVRILRKRSGDPIVDFGVIPEPILSYNNRYLPESLGLLEIELYGSKRLLSVDTTWLYYDVYSKAYGFRQLLKSYEPGTRFEPIYLFGLLVKEAPKSVMLRFGESDEEDKRIEVAFIPRMENDIIEFNSLCYRCQQVIFQKGNIIIKVDPQSIEKAVFEKDFFDPYGQHNY